MGKSTINGHFQNADQIHWIKKENLWCLSMVMYVFFVVVMCFFVWDMFQVLTTKSTKQTCFGLHQEYVHRWELKLETNLTAFHTWLVVSHLYMCINVPCTCSIMFPKKWMKALGWKLWDLPGIGDPAEHWILMGFWYNVMWL
jgi:hypothetical protein